MSGAQILVYVKDIIGFDAGHNYRRWPLQAAPTVFNTHTEKYVYAAIPRDMTLDASAWIVFPSEQIDIYGKNEKRRADRRRKVLLRLFAGYHNLVGR